MSASPPDDGTAYVARGVRDPELMEAALALAENRLHDAEPVLKARLRSDPFDVAAMRMLAELAARIGRDRDAENLLRRAVELAPGFVAARSNLATILYRQGQAEAAIAELDTLAERDADNLAHTNLRAAALGRLGEYEEAIGLYGELLRQLPDQPKICMSYGHLLKTVGKQGESVSAYRRALEIAPTLGEAWWSLANLKTVSFDGADRAAMVAAAQVKGLSDDDRLHLHFALGKALADVGEAEAAFEHYDKGNMIRRAQLGYDAESTARQVDRATALFTPQLIAARGGHGCPTPDPIFIVGMPRAGSTLIEQILASHSQIEGTMELPDMPAIAARVGAREGGLDAVSGEELRAFGEEYLARTRIQRKTDKPFFIDKLPNNWAHIGLIHLILPNAKIIDARRHPLDCCFSNFRQHFARGQSFSYGLEDMGRYYADYVRLMAHFDAVLPGRVHRVIHEALLDEPECEVRALLDYLGLAFEPECMRFHENERAVRTASSEQVRQPLNRDGVDQWRPYEAWLTPLKSALGPVLANYPNLP